LPAPKAWQIAEKSEITREALYQALRPNAQPRFDTVHKVMQAMGIKLQALEINAAD
jgi:probable addiction module antidote protein